MFLPLYRNPIAVKASSRVILLASLATTVLGCSNASLQPLPATDQQQVPTARNLIVFIGDGMGISTVTAGRILEGQLRGETGEENLLSFERFGHTALAKTYNSNQQTPDSAGTITAITTGLKTRAGVINIGPANLRGKCTGSERHALTSLFELARDAGMATGVATTARVTHATPAATYARSPERDWEADSAMTKAARDAGCRDIAAQLLHPVDGRGHDLVLGGGRAAFLPANVADPEYPESTGARRDGRNLTEEWQAAGGHYVWNAGQFNQLPTDPEAKLLGLFEPSHMRYDLDRGNDVAGEPSLAEMTTKAIDWLSARETGYLLMIEAGRIDHGHHNNNAARALHDTVALSAAVRVARERTGADTLIVVTADHSHVFTMGGYSTRGNPILGLVRGNDASGEPRNNPSIDGLGETYTTLAYANGPGFTGASSLQAEGYKSFPHEPATFQGMTRSRGTLDEQRTRAADFLQATLVPLASETHGGEDVPVYADGPGAEHFRGVIEQHQLFRLMVQAVPALRAHVCDRIECPLERGQAWVAPPVSALSGSTTER